MKVEFYVIIASSVILTAIIWGVFVLYNEIKKIRDDIVFHDAVYNSVFENIHDGVDLNKGKKEKVISKLRWKFSNKEIQKRMREYFSEPH